MPSDSPNGSGAPDARSWIRSQGLGIICGQATVVLLAIGSVVVSQTKGSATSGWFSDDLRFFFREPSIAHLWLWLLVPVLGLWGLNTLLCTWHNVLQRWRSGVRSAAAYGPAVIHAGFLLALLAHGIEGFFAEDFRPVSVGPDWTRLEAGGEEVRLADLTVELHPNGQPKEVRATLELRRGPDGLIRSEVVGINRPLSSGFGGLLHLVADFGPRIDTARIATATGEAFDLKLGQSGRLGGHDVVLEAIETEWNDQPIPPTAILRWSELGPEAAPTFLPLGESLRLPDGSVARFEATGRHDRVVLRPRRAPGNPWAFAAAAAMLAGCLMMGRRWL